MTTSGRGMFELSGWARARLAERVASGAENLSYVIPADFRVPIDEQREATVDLLAAVMDAVITHDACGERVLFELGQQESREDGAVIWFRREGGRSALCRADHERLERLAQPVDAQVRVVQDTPTSLTAVVSLRIGHPDRRVTGER